jgi:hypothetical protein
VGELEIYDKDSDEIIAKIEISQSAQHASKEHFALEMINTFQRIKTKSVRIVFMS